MEIEKEKKTMLAIIEKIFALLAFILSLLGGQIPTPEAVPTLQPSAVVGFAPERVTDETPEHAYIIETDNSTYATVETVSGQRFTTYAPHPDYICDLFQGDQVTVYRKNGVIVAMVSGWRTAGPCSPCD